VQVEVAVPFAFNVAEVQLTVRPVTEPATLTPPVKSSVLVRVRTSVVVVTPVLKLTSDEAAETLKSPTWTRILAEWLGAPLELVPVTVTP
jgi:hypothetical protein